MKNLLRSLSFIALSTVAFGQAQDKGVISFSAGYDAGIHGTIYTSQYQNNSPSTPDTSMAGTQLFRLNAHYNIFKFLSAGLDFRTGSYVEDPDNATSNGNKVLMYGLSLRLYPVNKDKFVWYVGANFGGSRLTIKRTYTVIVAIPELSKYKSPHTSFETGFNWYFTEKIGMNFGLGYSSQNFLLTYYKLNGEEYDLSDWTNKLTTKGIHFNLGLAVHL
ncbi:MAG: hypothetical protein EP305_08060 [Bacteroidetes bacterium]|nr:MAG: hypothetical protein EP305_08060 [Bacteroidota bacterium]